VPSALSDLQFESVNIQLVSSGLQILNSRGHAELVSASVYRIKKGIPKQVPTSS